MELLTIEDIAKRIDPSKTVLFFGAGSSIPSGAPSVGEVVELAEKSFQLGTTGLALNEIASLLEGRLQRRKFLEQLRAMLVSCKPTKGLLALPSYKWKAIYTTNYDELIELAYGNAKKEIDVFASDFDVSRDIRNGAVSLYKLHGTISQDHEFGHKSRLVISDADYDNTAQFREKLYRSFENDLNKSDLVIVGHSLKDPDIKEVVERVARLHNNSGSSFSIYFIAFERDELRAGLYLKRNFNVAFGSIDDFFSALGKVDRSFPEDLFAGLTAGALSARLAPSTTDVSLELSQGRDGIDKMFNGRAATYRDIAKGRTFGRDLVYHLNADISKATTLVACVLGAGGVGKTTLARQLLLRLVKDGWACWEHEPDHVLDVEAWVAYARALPDGHRAALFIDDANHHLNEINDLVDGLVSADVFSLRIVMTCAKNMWSPRIKTPNIYKYGGERTVSRLSQREIEALLDLVEANDDIRALVEPTFGGFSRVERRRRLVDRCSSDMFVCLRNIFASIKFDDIILQEFSSLDEDLQAVYRVVSALEAFGIRVHRQLVIRMTGIRDAAISSILARLDDIVSEYDVLPSRGVYGWRGRHQEISKIIRTYKYSVPKDVHDLLMRFIENISPNVPMEIASVRDVCQSDGGIRSIQDSMLQNRLYRKIITELPGERVPRHRLIQNLIRAGDYDAANAEIRIYENDLRSDGAISRYKIQLELHRAENVSGLTREDRLAIGRNAFHASLDAIARFPNNKYMYFSLGNAAKICFKYGGDHTFLDQAIKALASAEDRIGDPDVAAFKRRLEDTADPVFDGE